MERNGSFCLDHWSIDAKSGGSRELYEAPASVVGCTKSCRDWLDSRRLAAQVTYQTCCLPTRAQRSPVTLECLDGIKTSFEFPGEHTINIRQSSGRRCREHTPAP